MGASDLPDFDADLLALVHGLDRALTAARRIEVPAIGCLHFIPRASPDGRSLWGGFDRSAQAPEPVTAVFEVEGDQEPSLQQIAHYVASRRLARHYLSTALERLGGLVVIDGSPQIVSEFYVHSLRIPAAPFDGQVWKLRLARAADSEHVLELEYEFTELRGAHLYGVRREAREIVH